MTRVARRAYHMDRASGPRIAEESSMKTLLGLVILGWLAAGCIVVPMGPGPGPGPGPWPGPGVIVPFPGVIVIP